LAGKKKVKVLRFREQPRLYPTYAEEEALREFRKSHGELGLSTSNGRDDRHLKDKHERA
jgi:hypothetical protein